MKIAKSELQKIINEEIQDVLIEEGFMGDAWGGAKTIGREFVKGFMGTGAASDNPLSRGVHRAFGATLAPKIDKLLVKLEETLVELDEHPEGDRYKGRRATGETGEEGEKKHKFEKANAITEFKEDVIALSKKWYNLTTQDNSEDDEPETPQVDPGQQMAADDPAQSTFKEALRRLARAEIKKHFTS